VAVICSTDYPIEPSWNIDLSIVIPCFNEAKTVVSLVSQIESALGSLNINTQLVLIDDGSSDETWASIKSIKPGRQLRIKGIRLTRNRGKIFAQAIGIGESLTADLVAFMDADGQHNPDYLPLLIERARQDSLPCIGRRFGHKRGVRGSIGVAGLRLVSFIVGAHYDPTDSEYLIIPKSICAEIHVSRQLGVIPLVSVIYNWGPRTHVNIQINPGFEANRTSRWGLEDLWRKGVTQSLADPETALSRLSAIVAGLVFFTFSYGIVVGVQSLISGSFLGIGSVILAQSLSFAVLSSLIIVLMGFTVVGLKNSQNGQAPTQQSDFKLGVAETTESWKMNFE